MQEVKVHEFICIIYYIPSVHNNISVQWYNIYNQVRLHLPQYIKALTNDHKYFKSTLKRFLYHHSFYSMNEYYEYKEDRRI